MAFGILWYAIIGFQLKEDAGTFTPYELDIPEGFPEPIIPENNLLSKERVALGRMLFYDPILSSDSTISCASCHHVFLVSCRCNAVYINCH